MAKEEPWAMDPKPVKKVLSDDTYDDCMACRVTGSIAMISLGGWSYYSGMYNLRQREKEIMRSTSKYKMGSRQLGVITISATLVGMGLWRAFN